MINQKMGDYTIIESLGKGGFGSVWRGEASDGKSVALKILNPQVLENEKVVRKFFHEAMILAKLDHPHICKLLEFFPDGDNYAIVMEYIKGKELKKILREYNGPLPFELAYKIAVQSLDAFQYAYQNGILHRDIKPANIMVDDEGNSKIMDFGIAKMSSTASHDTAASMLSVHYVPPERFDKSREIDARSDIYSLGLVFYELFAGRRPFKATETSQIMFCHLNEIPDPPSKYSQGLPENISRAISRSLEKDPDDRYNDFVEFKQAIEVDQDTFDDATAIITGEETIIVSHQEDPTIAMEKPAGAKVKAVKVSKKPTGLIAAVVVGVLVIAGIAGYLILGRGKPAPPPTPTAVPAGQAQPAATAAGTPQPAQPAPEPAAPPEEKGLGQKNAKGFYEARHATDAALMVMVPSGPFTMGSDEYNAEKPVQQINLSTYYIDKYLVTNAQFQKFAADTGYKTDAEKEGAGMVRIGRRWKKVEGANWKMPDGLTAIDGKEDNPVSQVSYNDALAYCQWAGKDLPTEAQWEKAARGPEGNEYPWGDSEPNDTMANFDNIVGTTTPVTEYEKGQSVYGIQDMAGNVYQWCKDWYSTGERVPQDPTGPGSGTERVIKGGSFIEGIESLRSANRDRYAPDYSSFLFGFRCAVAKDQMKAAP